MPSPHRSPLVAYELLSSATCKERSVRAAHLVYESLIQLWTPGAIEAASDLGVFTALADRPATAEQLAAILAVDEHALALLLEALGVLGILAPSGPQRQGRVYLLPPEMRDCLLPGMYSLVGKVAYDREVAWAAWRGLARRVREGAVDDAGEPQVNQISADHYRTLVGGINFWAPPVVDLLATELARTGWASPGAESRRMLDVGCGTGLYSQLLMKRFSGLAAVGLDVAEILAIATEQAAELDVAERFTVRAGDFAADDWGDGYDLVLIANIFEMQTPASAQELVMRAGKALAPGGVLAIVDQIIDDQPESPQDKFATLFALSMLATGGGDSYRTADYRRWLATAGLELMALRDAPMHRVLLAGRS